MELSDKYTLESGTVYLTGIQALVRLPIDQMRRDRRQGLKTGAFISGYEGSPLAGYDLSLARNLRLLDRHGIRFQPGLNEEIAATSILGTQIVDVMGKPNVDGVVGIWYGKGPGVDRCGDIFRHANMAGSGKNGGALVLAGDDHACKSSTIPHQSDFSLYNIGIPIFFPGNAQEVIDLGLAAIAASRYSGAWVGLKCVTDVCDGGGTVTVDPGRPLFVFPEGYEKRVDARIGPPVTLQLEHEVNSRRLEAVRAFARANAINRRNGAAGGAWLGLVSAGKAHYDLLQALRDLGVRDPAALGIRIAQFGMTFPLETAFAREFAEGLELILVVEEKRSFLEMQLRETLYDLTARPAIIGKEDEQGRPLLPPAGDLDPDRLARILADVIGRKAAVPNERRLAEIEARAVRGPLEVLPVRAPNFCSGCPHNRSTLLLDGQVAGGGIGCHTMAMRIGDPNRSFSFLTQMGGEGAPWIGAHHFVDREHVFQNLGDGTFFHSGQLAVEACIAAGVNITYKILYNGHVAMTGGQGAIGALPVPQLAHKLAAEGVNRIVILAEEPTKYEGIALPDNTLARDRNALQSTLKELEQVPGVTVIIYDQQCAAERRRARSRGRAPEPLKRLVIHEEVCEGCGDCVQQSNCMSLTRIRTDFGEKMQIHQSSCNKDYSCALGDCPSFVQVKIRPGTGLRKRRLPQLVESEVPPRKDPVTAGNGYRIVMPGIGGTGVITVNALLATAAWIDGLSVVTLDQTGTAQKGGAVVSHLVFSDRPVDVAARTNIGNADLILGFDLIGLSGTEHLKTATPGRTVAVVNSDLTPTLDSLRGRSTLTGSDRLVDRVNRATTPGRNLFIDGSRLAEGLFGSHMATNLFLTGVAWQAGLIPVSQKAMEQAIEWNGAGAERNLQVFNWGRRYFVDPKSVEQLLVPPARKESLDVAERCEIELTAYQGKKYATEYREFVDRIANRAPALRDAVARGLYKLMAVKDEYEVARLLTRKSFLAKTTAQWEAVESITYLLHPPLLRRFGLKTKLELGPAWRPLLRLLALGKVVRGTPLDVFGWSRHRRLERSLVAWYRELVLETVSNLTADNTACALEIVSLPDRMRGFEQIKEKSIAETKKLAEEKLRTLKPSPVAVGVK